MTLQPTATPARLPRCIAASGFSFALFVQLLICRFKGEAPQILIVPDRTPAFLWFVHVLPFLRLPNGPRVVHWLASRLLPSATVTWLGEGDIGSFLIRPDPVFTHEILSRALPKDRSGVLAPPLTERLAATLMKRRPRFVRALTGLFFNDTDILFAFKKRFGEIAWEVGYNLYAATEEANGRPLTFLASRVEDSMVLAEVGTMNALDDNVTVVHAQVPVLSAALYQVSAFTVNLLAFFALQAGAVRSVRRNMKKPSGPYKIAFINNQSTARTTGGSTPETAIFGDVTFPVDDQIFHVDDIVVIGVARDGRQPRYSEEYARAGVACFDPQGTHLSWAIYRGLFLRRARHCLTLSMLALTSPWAALGTSLVPRMVRESLWWARVCANISFRTYLCVEEHSFSHAVRTVLFRQFGTYNVFFPNAILSRRSNLSAFYCYDLLMTAGAHLPRAYGGEWKQEMPVVPVGIMKNDTAAYCGQGYVTLSSPGFESFVAEQHASERKIISFILGSVGQVEFSKRHNLHLVRMAASILERHDTVTIVIKPKSTSEAFFRNGPAAEILAPFVAQGRAHIINHHRDSGTLCSVQCLAQASTACIFSSALGQPVSSAWVEVQMLGIPAFGFTPPETPITTPGLEPFRNVLLFTEESQLLQTLDHVIRGDWNNPITELSRAYWDPWCDGHGRERIIATIRQLIDEGPDFLRDLPTVRDCLENRTLLDDI